MARARVGDAGTERACASVSPTSPTRVVVRTARCDGKSAHAVTTEATALPGLQPRIPNFHHRAARTTYRRAALHGMRDAPPPVGRDDGLFRHRPLEAAMNQQQSGQHDKQRERSDRNEKERGNQQRSDESRKTQEREEQERR